MKLEVRFEKGGHVIFREAGDVKVKDEMPELFRRAVERLVREHPDVSLIDDDIWVRVDFVRQADT